VSLHGERLNQAFEDVVSFQDAWSLLESRRAGAVKIPRLCPSPALLDYASFASVGSQIERLQEYVSPDRIFFVFLSDLAECPRSVYQGILKFLGLEDDGREDFRIVHGASTRRWRALHSMVRRGAVMKSKLGFGYFGNRLNGIYDRLTTIPAEKPVLDRYFLKELESYFTEEVNKVEQITGRRLESRLLQQ